MEMRTIRKSSNRKEDGGTDEVAVLFYIRVKTNLIYIRNKGTSLK